jgi:NAD(P)-dependent dehydrogenase (short-subunit alcohol dehydrogenase family)
VNRFGRLDTGEQRRDRQSWGSLRGAPRCPTGSGSSTRQPHRRIPRYAGRDRTDDRGRRRDRSSTSPPWRIGRQRTHLHSYVAAKFGLRGITKSAAVELAQYNIPGQLDSPRPGAHSIERGRDRGIYDTYPAAPAACPGRGGHLRASSSSVTSRSKTRAEFVVDGGLTSYVPAKI